MSLWHEILISTAFWILCWIVHGLWHPCTSWPPEGGEWWLHLLWLIGVVAISTGILHLAF